MSSERKDTVQHYNAKIVLCFKLQLVVIVTCGSLQIRIVPSAKDCTKNRARSL